MVRNYESGSRSSKQRSGLISRVEMSGKNAGNKWMKEKQSWCNQKVKEPIWVHKKEQAPQETVEMATSDKGQLPPSNWVEPGSRPHRSLMLHRRRPPTGEQSSDKANIVHRYRGPEKGPGLVSVEVRCRSECSRDNGQSEP